MANERYPLRQVIFDDLFNHNKIALLLLIAVIGSALATIWIVHQTHTLRSEQGKIVKEIDRLNNRYMHLQLEENKESNRHRIEGVSSRLGLQPTKQEQEVLLEMR